MQDNRELADKISYFDAIEILYFAMRKRTAQGDVAFEKLLERLPPLLERMRASTTREQGNG